MRPLHSAELGVCLFVWSIGIAACEPQKSSAVESQSSKPAPSDVAALEPSAESPPTQPAQPAPPPAQPGEAKRYGLVIHGGAGTIDPASLGPGEEARYRETLGQALDAGYAVLDGGGTSLDAVVAVVVILEDSPLFNAGKGSVFTHEGTNEMDASIMDGATGKAGAVAGISAFKNPILVARKVMTDSPHVMLAGEGAHEFGDAQGLERVPPEYFRNDARWEQLQKIRKTEGVELDHGSRGGDDQPDDKFGTVGAVAVDRNGRLAAATSTGGMTNKRWGRIGDAPIIGAGTFADDATCAVSSTGHGEFFIRVAAAHSVSARMAYGGQSLEQAANAVIFEQLLPIGGMGGLIAIDRDGNVAMPFNTPGMYRGVRLSDGTRGIHIWKEGESDPTPQKKP